MVLCVSCSVVCGLEGEQREDLSGQLSSLWDLIAFTASIWALVASELALISLVSYFKLEVGGEGWPEMRGGVTGLLQGRRPPAGWVKLNFDGRCCGRPNRVGVGGIVRTLTITI